MVAGATVALLLGPACATTSPPSTAQPVPPTPAPTTVAPTVRPAGVPLDAQPAVVEQIVDGGTIRVRIEQPGWPLPQGATHDVRLLGIEAPGVTQPGRNAACGGPEAAAFAIERLPVGSTVHLLTDGQGSPGYVWTSDGQFFNLETVRTGHARVVLPAANDAHAIQMRTAEAEARTANRGIWGTPCDLDAPPPPPPPPPPAPAPAPVPAPANSEAANSEPAVGCDPNYTPCLPAYPPDLDCPDIGHEVKVIGGDPHRLDRDRDGTGCDG
ncbi:MAG: thermonuclease family protein [Egibacteraceae bacterium]